MKKILFLSVIATVVLSGCTKDNEELADSLLKGTSWTARDDIAEMIYGKTCTTTIEFIDNRNCKEIDKRVGMIYGAGTFVETGTYFMKADSVVFTINNLTYRGKVSGSTMTTSISTIGGGKRVYTKN